MTGIECLADSIKAELEQLLPEQRKTPRGKLSLLVATLLDARSANRMDLAAALPLATDRTGPLGNAQRYMRHQWIARFLANPRVDPDAVMAPFARQVLGRHVRDGEPLALILDQTKISERHQVLMLAVRFGERALPLAWRVAATEGGIGFETQKALLDTVAPWVPPSASVTLLGDRFYGTAALIGWCQERGWDYRLRLKGNLVVVDGDTRTTPKACAADRVFCLEDVDLTGKRARTNIGIIHDPGHAQPWIIAMSATPGSLKTLEYGGRWGIEPMFSDFKSRGFGVEDTHIHRPEHLGRLLLVMALALHWAVSTGLWDARHHPTPGEKKT